MLRSGASRSILRSLNTASNPISKVTSAPIRRQFRSQLCSVSRRPQVVPLVKPLAPKTLALVRWQSKDERPTVDQVDTKREEKIQQKKIEPTPELVSTTSTTIAPTGNSGRAAQEDEPKMMAGINADLVSHCYSIGALFPHK